MRKIMMNPNSIFWVRLSMEEEDPEAVPVTASENSDDSGFSRLLLSARTGYVTICEDPVEHDPNYGATTLWMKERAAKLITNVYPRWIEPFLPSKHVINSLVAPIFREAGVTIWTPSPEERVITEEPLPAEPKVPVEKPQEEPPQKGSTLLMDSEPGTPTGTLFDKRTMVILPGTGSQVVQVNTDAKPVLLPRSLQKGKK